MTHPQTKKALSLQGEGWVRACFVILLCLLTFPASANDLTGTQIDYTTKDEDTFVHLARTHELGFVELRAANPGVDPWLPGADRNLILPKRNILPDAPRKGIVINLAEMRLFYFKDKDDIQSYPIGIGREGLQTPLGQTSVVRKAKDPQWRPTARMRKEDPALPAVVEPGPDNPLGNRILYLGWPTYAIHGTNRPLGIGRRVSSGCIRLYPEGIEALWDQVPTGTPVTVVDQSIKAGWADDIFYVEAHPTMDQANIMEQSGTLPHYTVEMDDLKYIHKAAGDYADKLDWAKIRTIIRERRGYPIEILMAKS